MGLLLHINSTEGRINREREDSIAEGRREREETLTVKQCFFLFFLEPRKACGHVSSNDFLLCLYFSFVVKGLVSFGFVRT